HEARSSEFPTLAGADARYRDLLLFWADACDLLNTHDWQNTMRNALRNAYGPGRQTSRNGTRKLPCGKLLIEVGDAGSHAFDAEIPVELIPVGHVLVSPAGCGQALRHHPGERIAVAGR